MVSVTNGANGWASLRMVSSPYAKTPLFGVVLTGFDIPVGKVIPDEVVERVIGFAKR